MKKDDLIELINKIDKIVCGTECITQLNGLLVDDNKETIKFRKREKIYDFETHLYHHGDTGEFRYGVILTTSRWTYQYVEYIKES